jgi:hypothetical protein
VLIQRQCVSEGANYAADAVARWCATAAWRLLLKGCQMSGPAAIKWAQWSACRPDVFPADMCEVLSQMHDDAPAHRWSHTAQELQTAFGRDLEHLFVAMDREPIASGSIAQVSSNRMSSRAAGPVELHPRLKRQHVLGKVSGGPQVELQKYEKHGWCRCTEQLCDAQMALCNPRLSRLRILEWLRLCEWTSPS